MHRERKKKDSLWCSANAPLKRSSRNMYCRLTVAAPEEMLGMRNVVFFFLKIYWKRYNYCNKFNVNISFERSGIHYVLWMRAQPQTQRRSFHFFVQRTKRKKTKSHRRQNASSSFTLLLRFNLRRPVLRDSGAESMRPAPGVSLSLGHIMPHVWIINFSPFIKEWRLQLIISLLK